VPLANTRSNWGVVTAGREGEMIMATFIACPVCPAIAQVTERFVLDSTDGPIEHLAVSCAAGHHFRMPVDSLPAGGRHQFSDRDRPIIESAAR
jgi:hypothetical protein